MKGPTARGLGAFAGFFVLTAGVYWLWLLRSWAHDINELYGSRRFSPNQIVLLTVLTLGIAGFYYHWRLATELPAASIAAGAPADHEMPSRVWIALALSVAVSFFSGGLALLLSMVLLGWASWQVQRSLNTAALASLPAEVVSALPG